MRNFTVKPSMFVPREKGLFAEKNFKEGEMLYIGFAPKKDVPVSAIWEEQFTQSKENSFVNHHATKANIKSVWLPETRCIIKVATRPITAGEEIKADYRQTIELIESLGYTTQSDWLFFMR